VRRVPVRIVWVRAFRVTDLRQGRRDYRAAEVAIHCVVVATHEEGGVAPTILEPAAPRGKSERAEAVLQEDRVGHGISVVEDHVPSCVHRQRAWRGANRSKHHRTAEGLAVRWLLGAIRGAGEQPGGRGYDNGD